MVGFVLLLGALIAYYGYVAQEDVPRWGAEAEQGWDRQVGDALVRLDRAATASVGTTSAVTVLVPPAPEPRAFDMPLVGRAAPARPAGTLSFAPACGGVLAEHHVAGSTIRDVVDGAKGCLVFRGDPSYSAPFGYRGELGGMLRVQGDKASVLAGPPLDLAREGPTYRVSLTLVGLTGAYGSLGADRAGVTVDLLPGAASVETANPPNAAHATWTFTTPYPDAWRTWFDDQLSQAGFDAAGNYACTKADGRCPGLGADQVRIVLKGPDADGATLDLRLSLSYVAYTVVLR